MRKVKLGSEEYEIQRFRGLKAILVMAAMTRIARDVPDILADAVKDYTRRNTIVVTEPMSRLPRWNGFSKEDFDHAEASTGKREIELPSPMTQQDQVLQALPRLLEGARKEVIRLFAILIVPNAELRQADEQDDSVEDLLDHYREVLLYEAELDQLADLVLVARDVLSDQLADRKERLGNLLESLVKMFKRPAAATSTSETSPSTQEEQPEEQTTTSTDDVQTSSTDSESPTDGVEAPRSMASLGAN